MLAGMGTELPVTARPHMGVVAEQLGGKGDSPLRSGKRVVLLDLKR